MSKKLKKNPKIINNVFKLAFILLLATFLLFNTPLLFGKKNDNKDNLAYQKCLYKPYQEDELSENLKSIMLEIDNLVKENKYDVAIKYEDMKTGFNYSYNENKVFYGASLIKLVDALYLIDLEEKNNLNLDEVKIKYTNSYVKSHSLGLATKRIGDSLSLRELIRYAVSVSDNSAHAMLFNYIGFNNLQKYGRSLGAKVILTGSDNFGNQTVYDTNIYLKKAYSVILDNHISGSFLKEIMNNDYRNAYNNSYVKIYHKYGSWGVNYHDIGLNLDIENPYAISILSHHEGDDYLPIFQNIHKLILKLHNNFYNERKLACQKAYL